MRRPGVGGARRSGYRGIGGSLLLAPSISIAGTRGGTLTATVTGVPTPTVQWYRGSLIGGGGTFSAIVGATSLTYDDALTYQRDAYCIATNAAASTTSNTLAATVVSGIANITNANYFVAAAGGPDFTSGLGAIGVVFRKISSGNMVREWRFSRYVANTSGYRAMIYDGTNSRVQMTAVNNTPTNVSEVNTIAALGQNTLHRFVATANGGVLETYMDGALLSAGTALASYTAATAAFRIEASGATDEIEIVSVSVAAGVGMSSAEVTTWDAQVIGGGSRAVPDATHHWEAMDWDAAASWTDRIAALALTLAASAPTKREITGAAWA